MHTLRRAIMWAVAVNLTAALLMALGVTPAVYLLSPGFITAWHGTSTEGGGLAAFLGVNLLFWTVILLPIAYLRGRLVNRSHSEHL